ncbi:hypothetical protein, partial [Bacteroides acidifaciens]|uniref:hypothetical protein n=1 Tax=Bacteroides acidifaciens TaxID=85831 RepID=UPI001ADD6D48
MFESERVNSLSNPKQRIHQIVHCGKLILHLPSSIRNHSIFRHDNFIGCSSADKIKMPARKYFCFNIPVYKNMVEESS